MTLTERHEELTHVLTRHGQDHLLRFYDRLDQRRRLCLLEQVEEVDWLELTRLIETHVRSRPAALVHERVEPAPYLPKSPPPELRQQYDAGSSLGETLLADGRVAAFTVAGGQGTRLGWDGPKGTFPATPVTGKSLFQVHAERILKAQATFGAEVPWYLMTSPLNHVASRDFFAAHDSFGLRSEQVVFLQQGTMPSVGLDGRVLLADRDRLAVNPDGTGGSLRALYRSGALADMVDRGVSAISYFQVDNPNAKFLDPLFVGLHAGAGAEMSSKTLRKAGPAERVGTMALLDGRLGVIEYSDIPRELAEARDPDGSYRFDAGSIAMHVISPEFVRRLNEGGTSLPFHRADKRVDHIDDDGILLVPATDNAVKLEMFVFDALPLARNGIVLETDRVEEFAPIKNAHGDDSPASSKRLQSERAARWLEQYGVEVPRTDEGALEAVIELSPLTAATAEDLRDAVLPKRIRRGEVVVL